ncbi:MAG: ABC transporter ATP-binding protein [Nitrososphaerota archaeon]|nr:ABC transporter ATP-binding protein [Nitrososphaerota archaeon]MDG6937213.1 ABC transporter ATP-binding protein [Nitrososphaerota archaeon]MDG6961772.1 ABC transporter ATP-binding protein [Nitrososphaerota archaeon]MDG6980788.1 ABC transporter ATP-binding protein [Nitrososphaerota archaeon]MDG6993018.1 ABC transporter ATP-binding protein [Nitrososphaerota archaeon]
MVKVSLENLDKSFGGHKVIDNLNLSIGDREFLTLLGPSGCGKTTTLRCIAGLEEVDSGRIVVDDRVINGVPSKDRDIAMVFQNYALYPFMSVRDNISFPLRLHKLPKDKIEKKVDEVAELLHISTLLSRKPKQLSGGEQQRVALGRALVRDPKLFLMDEPFSNLDAKLRVETRSEIKRLQGELGITTIFVTHDQSEAMALADRIAVMDKGVLQQFGGPTEVYDAPTNVMVAQFMGAPAMNVLDGEFSKPDKVALTGPGLSGVVLARDEVARGAGSIKGNAVRVGFRPEDAKFVPGGSGGIPAEVYVEEPLGTHVLLTLTMGGVNIKVVMPAGFRAGPGVKGTIEIAAGKLHVFDAGSNVRVS